MGLLVLGWATFGSLVIGALYVLSAQRSTSLGQRLLAAAYAPAAALLFVMVALLPRSAWPVRFPLFLSLQLIPLVLLLVSLRVFAGPRWVHWVLAPLALVCLVWQAFWGHIAIHGE